MANTRMVQAAAAVLGGVELGALVVAARRTTMASADGFAGALALAAQDTWYASLLPAGLFAAAGLLWLGVQTARSAGASTKVLLAGLPLVAVLALAGSLSIGGASAEAEGVRLAAMITCVGAAFGAAGAVAIGLRAGRREDV